MVMRLKDVGGYQPMFETSGGDACLEQLQVTPRVRLLGNFLYKGDFAVLCGAEGSGKSLLAFQLADALSKGQAVEGFDNDSSPQKVMFLDFENKHERFIRRYSEEGVNRYKLSENLFRTTFSSKFTEYVGLRKEFHLEINKRVLGRNPEVLVVNNLDTARCFLSESFLISLLKEYQAKMGLTVVLVCSINPGKAPLHLWRISRNLRELSDSIMAIGKSKQGKNIRYLKQLKSSAAETVYEENELPEFSIEQQGNFTGFWHRGFSLEEEHLTGPPVGLDLEIVEMKNQQPGLTLKEIAEKLETNKARVMRALARGWKGLRDVGVPDCLSHAGVKPAEERAGNDTAIPHTDSRLRGNDDLPHSLPFDPFSCDVELPGNPSDAGANPSVKSQQTLDALVTHNFLSGTETTADEENDARADSRLRENDNPAHSLSRDPFSGDIELPGNSSDAGGRQYEEHTNDNITNPRTDSRLRGNDNPAHSLPIDPFRGDVGIINHPSGSGVNPSAKSQQTLDALVTHNFLSGTETTADEENDARTDSRLRGNDGPQHSLPPVPFRGDVELPGNSSDAGVKESLKILDELITSYCTSKPPSETQNRKMTYSQQLKKRFAEARRKK